MPDQIRLQIARCDMLAANRNPDRPSAKRRNRGHDGKLFCKYALRKRETFLRTKLAGA